MFLSFSRCVHFADANVQPDSLLSATLATMAPRVAANIEVIVTSSSTDPGAKPSGKVPPTSKAILMFSFKAVGSSTGNILEESSPSESAPITTIIVTLGGLPLP